VFVEAEDGENIGFVGYAETECVRRKVAITIVSMKSEIEMKII
jgi:hypothetical protein